MSARTVKSKKKAAAKKKGVKTRAVKKKAVKEAGKKKPAKKKAVKTRAVKKKKTVKKAAKKRPALTPEQAKARRAARAAYRKLLKKSGERLEAKRRSLIAAYHSAKGNTRSPSADGTEDYIDYAVSSYDRDFTLSLTEMERKQLMLVEDALRRVQRKEYGKCLQCGQEIPPPRLEVEPWARHCIRCQELEEQGLLEDLPETQGDEDEVEEGPAGEAEEEPDVEIAADAAETDAAETEDDDDDEEDDDQLTL